MMPPSTKLKFEDTTFVNEFYPFKGATEIALAFKPMEIASSSKLRMYCVTKKILTSEQIDLLDYVFGDSASITDAIDHNNEAEEIEDDENEEYINEDENIFHCTNAVNMKVSPTGKENNISIFYWTRYTYKEKVNMSPFINFVFYNKGNFYGIQPSGFIAQVKSCVYNRETRKFDEDALELLFKNLNDDKYGGSGYDLLKGVNFKCSKTSISKILISFFPQVNMQHIVELSDFIKSEMLTNKSTDEVSRNIFEVKGELITYFYNVKNYQYPKEGTLGQSCMKFDTSTEQIKFYANNPTNVGLLSLIENKKLLARSVLWTDVEGKKFTDRIYCSSSKHAIRLAAYCKQKGYKTIYSSSGEHGIEYSNKCIVQLDSFELHKSNYPYLDTMGYIDVINKIVSPNCNYLLDYLNNNNKDYLLKSINTAGGISHVGQDAHFRKNNKKGLKYLKDGHGNPISDHLFRYALIRKPKISIVNRKDIVTINEDERVDYTWCEDTLIKKYNSIRPTLCFKKTGEFAEKYTVQYMDKQYVVYSTYHKFYVSKVHSEFVSSISTYVLKEIIPTTNFQAYLRVSKLRKLYGGKLVRITTEYLTDLNKQIAVLPFKESLMDIRKSRVYNISTKNILWNGVRIKGILIPFNQLRFIKK